MRILVVEDEKKVAYALREGLEAANCAISLAATGEEALFLADRQSFDLVLLDLMLPRCSGVDVIAKMRTRGIETPVLVLTAKDTVTDRVQALDIGADDYLAKPFAFPELLARVRALKRRGQSHELPKLRTDDLEMDIANHRVRRGKRLLDLTKTEFDILEYLLRHHDRVVSREMLAREVWNLSEFTTPSNNAIDIMMTRLRRKIDDANEQKLLRTVRGLGYQLGSW